MVATAWRNIVGRVDQHRRQHFSNYLNLRPSSLIQQFVELPGTTSHTEKFDELYEVGLRPAEPSRGAMSVVTGPTAAAIQEAVTRFAESGAGKPAAKRAAYKPPHARGGGRLAADGNIRAMMSGGRRSCWVPSGPLLRGGFFSRKQLFKVLRLLLFLFWSPRRAVSLNKPFDTTSLSLSHPILSLLVTIQQHHKIIPGDMPITTTSPRNPIDDSSPMKPANSTWQSRALGERQPLANSNPSSKGNSDDDVPKNPQANGEDAGPRTGSVSSEGSNDGPEKRATFHNLSSPAKSTNPASSSTGAPKVPPTLPASFPSDARGAQGTGAQQGGGPPEQGDRQQYYGGGGAPGEQQQGKGVPGTSMPISNGVPPPYYAGGKKGPPGGPGQFAPGAPPQTNTRGPPVFGGGPGAGGYGGQPIPIPYNDPYGGAYAGTAAGYPGYNPGGAARGPGAIAGYPGDPRNDPRAQQRDRPPSGVSGTRTDRHDLVLEQSSSRGGGRSSPISSAGTPTSFLQGTITRNSNTPRSVEGSGTPITPVGYATKQQKDPSPKSELKDAILRGGHQSHKYFSPHSPTFGLNDSPKERDGYDNTPDDRVYDKNRAQRRHDEGDRNNIPDYRSSGGKDGRSIAALLQHREQSAGQDVAALLQQREAAAGQKLSKADLSPSDLVALQASVGFSSQTNIPAILHRGQPNASKQTTSGGGEQKYAQRSGGGDEQKYSAMYVNGRFAGIHPVSSVEGGGQAEANRAQAEANRAEAKRRAQRDQDIRAVKRAEWDHAVNQQAKMAAARQHDQDERYRLNNSSAHTNRVRMSKNAAIMLGQMGIRIVEANGNTNNIFARRRSDWQSLLAEVY